MKARTFPALIVSIAAVLLGSAGALAGVESPVRADSANDSRAKTGKPALEKGMTAETILQLIGKPQEIAPRASPEGKAETWTYRRILETKHLLVASAVETIPVFLRASPTEGNVMGTATRPIYNFKHITTYQVTALLMFDGKLVVAKQWREQEQSYDN